MFRRAACLIAVGIVSLTLLPSPASASHGWDQPDILHERTTSGAYWVAYKVKTNGAGVSTHFNVDTVKLPNQMGAMIYKGKTPWFGIVFSYYAGHNGVFVDVNVVPDQPVHFEISEPTPDYPWIKAAMNMNGFGTQNPYVGDLTFVWWIAGGNKSVNHSIEAEPGAELTGGRPCPPDIEPANCTFDTGFESGTKTFVYTSQQFMGRVNVRAGNGISQARVNVSGTRSVTIDETALMVFASFGTHADQLTIEKPDGSTQDCTISACILTSIDESRAGPGEYTFHATGAGGGTALTYFGEFLVGGADLRLPA